jgi:hypothetical protein
VEGRRQSSNGNRHDRIRENRCSRYTDTVNIAMGNSNKDAAANTAKFTKKKKRIKTIRNGMNTSKILRPEK